MTLPLAPPLRAWRGHRLDRLRGCGLRDRGSAALSGISTAPRQYDDENTQQERDGNATDSEHDVQHRVAAGAGRERRRGGRGPANAGIRDRRQWLYAFEVLECRDRCRGGVLCRVSGLRFFHACRGGSRSGPRLDAALTSNVWLHFGQRIRAGWALSGSEPLDWHEGQTTTLATAPSC